LVLVTLESLIELEMPANQPAASNGWSVVSGAATNADAIVSGCGFRPPAE
jgi:hypothetical protein